VCACGFASALAAGIALSVLTPPTVRLAFRRLAFVSRAALLVFLLAALAATLALPRNPWRTPWRAWPAFAPPEPPPLGEADETVALVLKAMRSEPDAAAAAGRREARTAVVLADAPGFQRRFAPAGVNVIPLWSPQADWLFDASLPSSVAAERWRDSGVRYLIVTKWQANLDFLNAHSRWAKPPFHVRHIGQTTHTAIFALRADE